MTEWFRAIPGFPDYNVSNYGRVINIITLRAAFMQKTQDGYLVPQLYDWKSRQVNPVHILVAEAFLGSIPANKVVIHVDGNITNNFLGNLRLQDPPRKSVEKETGYRYVNPLRKERDKTIKTNKSSIPIRDIDTGQEFPSIQHAYRALKISNKKIAQNIRGLRPDADGHRFEKVEATK